MSKLDRRARNGRLRFAQSGTVHSSLIMRPMARGTPADQAGGAYDAAQVLGSFSHRVGGARIFLENNP